MNSGKIPSPPLGGPRTLIVYPFTFVVINIPLPPLVDSASSNRPHESLFQRWVNWQINAGQWVCRFNLKNCSLLFMECLEQSAGITSIKDYGTSRYLVPLTYSGDVLKIYLSEVISDSFLLASHCDLQVDSFFVITSFFHMMS